MRPPVEPEARAWVVPVRGLATWAELSVVPVLVAGEWASLPDAEQVPRALEWLLEWVSVPRVSGCCRVATMPLSPLVIAPLPIGDIPAVTWGAFTTAP